MKNPVAKWNNTVNKPAVHRDRKKNPSKAQQIAWKEEHAAELTHHKMEPYKRPHSSKWQHFEEEDVNNDWYIVFQKQGKWWFTDLDDSLGRAEHGPFASPAEAHEGALRYAQHDDV